MVSLEDEEVDLVHRGIHGDRHSQQGHLAYMMTLEDDCYTSKLQCVKCDYEDKG